PRRGPADSVASRGKASGRGGPGPARWRVTAGGVVLSRPVAAHNPSPGRGCSLLARFTGRPRGGVRRKACAVARNRDVISTLDATSQPRGTPIVARARVGLLDFRAQQACRT